MPTIVKKYKPRAKELKGLKREVREYNSIINFNNAFDIARKECYEYLERLYSKER